jgi:RimJ/RimL family protein N-acetyltransferase
VTRSRPTPAVVLRSVGPADEDLLLRWANDPATRAGSRSHGLITAAEHHAWLHGQLAAPDRARAWIGETDGRPIGIVRFERRTPASVEVGITVAPEVRGRGLARPLLDAGIEAARAVFGAVAIRADILSGNAASRALFTGAGFAPVGTGAADSDAVSDAAQDTDKIITLELP